MVKIIIGIIIIAASFIFVLRSPDKSMMDRLLERKKAERPAEPAGTEGTPNEPGSPRS